MQSVTDDGYMVVWPRVRMDIFEKCQSVEYVTLVPKKNPNYAIDIEIDEKCKIKSFKKRPRKGI